MTTASSASFPPAIAQRVDLFSAMQAIGRETTLPYFRSRMDVDNKLAGTGDYDPVTQADKGCERALRELIESRLPDDGIFGEEYGNVRLDAPFVWVIDPIDGTRGFVAGLPLWGMLVGLLHNGKPVAGLGYQPFLDEAFWTPSPSEAMTSMRGKTMPLVGRKGLGLHEATLFTTTPALFDETERPAYDALESAVRNVRYGADWYAYALLACGTADLVVESGLSAYDILPLVPLIEATGGLVTDWQGNPLAPVDNPAKRQVLAVADPALIEPATAFLQAAAR